MVIAALAGLLLDQLLLMVFVSRQAAAVAGGKPERVYPRWLVDTVAIAETGLLIQALELDRALSRNFLGAKSWLDRWAKHLFFVRTHHARICWELVQRREGLRSAGLADYLLAKTDPARRTAFFAEAVRLASSGGLGVTQAGLDWLAGLALSLDRPPDQVAVVLWEKAELNAAALALFPACAGGADRGREALLAEYQDLRRAAAGHPDREDRLGLAYGILEDQYDLIDRSIECYARSWKRPGAAPAEG